MKPLRLLIFLILLALFTGVRPTQSAQPVTLHLAWGSTDPLTVAPRSLFPSALRTLQINTAPQYFIVQFDAPTTDADRVALENTGARLLGYLPDFAYIVYAPRTNAARLQTLRNVRWVGEYLPAYRLDPALYRARAAAQLQGEKMLNVELTLFPTQDVASLLPILRAQGIAPLQIAVSPWATRLALQIQPHQLESLLILPGAAWLEAAPQWQVHTNAAADLVGVRPLWDTHGLYGQGQIIAVADTGFDNGIITDTAQLHDDFENGAGSSRVLAIYDLAADNNNSDPEGHGTHVSGTILGNGALSGSFPITHTFPNTAYVGMAPDANLVIQTLRDQNDNGFDVPLSIYADLFTPIYTATYGSSVARIHNNSWGDAVRGMYTAYAQEVDQFVWDHPDFLIVFSAGNDGLDSNSDGIIDLNGMGAPGTAKNALTVGASENYHLTSTSIWSGTRYPAAPINGDYRAHHPNGLAAFSNRGYTLDGRLKPDIVAPGTYLVAPCSDVYTGACLAANTNYLAFQGTSMAAPIVSGSAALARQYYRQIQGHTPSAALLKATLLNGAYDIYPGQYGTGATQEISQTRPSPQAGWGRVNLESTLFPQSGRVRWWWDITAADNPLSTGETVTYTFEVTQTAPLSVTLAWSDYPGNPAAAGGLVNDLDLRLTDPNGTLYYANHAAQRGATAHLQYGDAATLLTTLVDNTRRAVKFTASADGTLDRALFYAYATAYPKTITYQIYSESGGFPDTLLASGSSTLRLTGWQTLDLSAHALSFTAGQHFFISLTLPDTNTQLAADDIWIDNRSFYDVGLDWTADTDYDYAIQATLVGSAPITPYDRVNNVEGIDLAAPMTGVYTLTVSGYNVPYAPQPYALVISSVGRLLGTETNTQTISASGVYTFGQSGATIQFNSEDIDHVTVNVQRNHTPVTTNPADKTIHRLYTIETQGGSGTFNADVTFRYEQSEVPPGVDESNLQACRWNGSTWTCYPSTVDDVNNTVTVSGVTEFSPWILAEPTPTALVLTELRVAPTISASVGFVLAFVMFALLWVALRWRVRKA